MGGPEVGVERVEYGGGMLELGQVAGVGDDREPGVRERPGEGPDEAVASASRTAASLTAAAFREGRPDS
jgi:hypothetical protein